MGIDPKARHQQKKFEDGKRQYQVLVSTVAALVLTSLDAVARIGYADIWPLFGSANQLLSALVERTIGLVKAYFKAQKESA